MRLSFLCQLNNEVAHGYSRMYRSQRLKAPAAQTQPSHKSTNEPEKRQTVSATPNPTLRSTLRYRTDWEEVGHQPCTVYARSGVQKVCRKSAKVFKDEVWDLWCLQGITRDWLSQIHLAKRTRLVSESGQSLTLHCFEVVLWTSSMKKP